MGNLKTTVVTASVSRLAGGLFTSVRRLHQCLNELPGVSVKICTLKDEHTDADLPEWDPLPMSVFSVRGPRAFGYASALRCNLLHEDADILHTHGIWQYPSVAVSAWHRQTRKPYLISPHGMLDSWAVKNSAWKKHLALMLYEHEHLGNAACLRALCESEAQAIRHLGLKNPIAIIPNGIDLPSIVESSGLRVESLILDRFAQGRKVLLYLGRIHPKKGLVNLLRAWASVQTTCHSPHVTRKSEWMLAIAGWDQGGHEAELISLCAELQIPFVDIRDNKSEIGNRRSEIPAPSVLFLGPQFGEAKSACYRNCDAFILPSFSEGLPMVILEAWAHGKPVLMTPECNLPEGFAANAAIRIEPNVESIAQGLNQLFSSPPAYLGSLGANGQALVAARFTWPKIAAEMKSVYVWVLGGGAKPDCVMES
jgi:poly(glycerol-phosphate) alpha-glucosyltransferase